MNVAIDARKLFDGGIGTYTRCLAEALVAHEPGVALTMLLAPGDIGRVRWPGAVAERPVRAGKYGFAEHWRVPAAASAAGAALLHEPHYTLPLGWNGPAVVTIHDLIHLCFPQFFPPGAALYARAMAGAAANRARIVCADSECTRRDVVQRLGVPESKVRVTPLGVSPEFAPSTPEALAAFRAARRLPEGFVLYVGARKRHKNLSLLLKALSTMPREARPPLVLSGSPWEHDDPLAREAAASGVAASVHFAGPTRGDGELRLLYGAAALYVQPSLYEGFGLPPLEAMACGTPVLSSNAGSLAEVLGDAAELLPPRDPWAWAERVRTMLADSELRAKRIAQGVRHAASFRWEHTARLTRQAYDEALAG